MPCPRNPFRALRIIAFMRTVMGCCVGRAFLPWNNSSKKPVSRITPTNFRLDPLVSPSFFHRSFFRSLSIRVFSLRGNLGLGEERRLLGANWCKSRKGREKKRRKSGRTWSFLERIKKACRGLERRRKRAGRSAAGCARRVYACLAERMNVKQRYLYRVTYICPNKLST